MSFGHLAVTLDLAGRGKHYYTGDDPLSIKGTVNVRFRPDAVDAVDEVSGPFRLAVLLSGNRRTHIIRRTGSKIKIFRGREMSPFELHQTLYDGDASFPANTNFKFNFSIELPRHPGSLHRDGELEVDGRTFDDQCKEVAEYRLLVQADMLGVSTRVDDADRPVRHALAWRPPLPPPTTEWRSLVTIRASDPRNRSRSLLSRSAMTNHTFAVIYNTPSAMHPTRPGTLTLRIEPQPDAPGKAPTSQLPPAISLVNLILTPIMRADLDAPADSASPNLQTRYLSDPGPPITLATPDAPIVFPSTDPAAPDEWTRKFTIPPLKELLPAQRKVHRDGACEWRMKAAFELAGVREWLMKGVRVGVLGGAVAAAAAIGEEAIVDDEGGGWDWSQTGPAVGDLGVAIADVLSD